MVADDAPPVLIFCWNHFSAVQFVAVRWCACHEPNAVDDAVNIKSINVFVSNGDIEQLSEFFERCSHLKRVDMVLWFKKAIVGFDDQQVNWTDELIHVSR